MGLNAEGGSAGARHNTRASESSFRRCLPVTRSPGGARWGFFLRAETMHGFALLDSRFDSPGCYCLDEPEAALSFASTLALVGVLDDLSLRHIISD